MNMSRVLSILRDRKLTVLACLVLSLAVCAIGYFNTKPRYKAEAILALDVRKLQALPIEAVVSPLPQESPVLRTELDIIGSRTMAERVASRMEDLGIGVESSTEGSIRQSPTASAQAADASEKSAENEALVEQLMSNVRVANDGRSYTIYISFTADDPNFAAVAANAYGEAYIEYQIDLQTSATRRVSDWLGEKLVDLRTKLEESERLATDFRERAGIVSTDGTTLQSQQIAGLNNELTALRARAAAAEARLSTAIDVQRNGTDLELSEVLSSPMIQQLRGEEARIKRTIAELDESGAMKNVQLPQLKSQLVSLQTQIGTEVSRIIESLRNEIEVNRRQQAGLEESIKETRASMATYSQTLVHADQLDREASANRAIYESYLTRYKQTIEQDGIATAEARMISRATPSSRPTSPNPYLWLVAGIAFGLTAGIAAAFLRHLTERKVRSADTLEARTGLSVITKVPRGKLQYNTNASILVHDQSSSLGRAMAEIQSQLRLFADAKATRARAARAIAIASVSGSRSKSHIVANLARLVGATGLKTIVIEANLRNPTLAEEFGLSSAAHLEQVVMQEIPFDDAIQRDPSSIVDVIPAQSSNAPESVLANQRFALLIQEMKRRYDLVLIDMPCASNGFDLMRIASFCDDVVLVVRPKFTRVFDLEACIKKLRAANRSIAGIVFDSAYRPKGAMDKKTGAPPHQLYLGGMRRRKRRGDQAQPIAASL
ncbi:MULTISPECIES: GumC family protein [unclassified Sinorhizobium]|uniref:GumC family protein n=1 Tax=unclassified Sinorhizobium TaxID=2613772 RepID=UPI0035267EC0